MLFSSMFFIWVFLSFVIAVNFLFDVIRFKDFRTKIKFKNAFLLIMSLIFYAWGGIYALLIILSSVLINFAAGLLIVKIAKSKTQQRLYFVLSIILNLAMLFFFKYFNMLVVVIEALMQNGSGFSSVLKTMISMQGTGALGFKEIALPIGISFFTFQAMSYVIDVYTKKGKLQENIIDFALYVTLFPQLIAGPIVKYSDIDLQLRYRKESLAMFTSGQKRFIYGLGKKVLISNTVAKLADSVWGLEIDSLGATVAWAGLIAYTLQIYFDFSGYSDMAIGLGRMLGFSFKENFNYPYTSFSVQEFWRRWHISLSTWFREYVYIPLGGNRKGKLRTYINLLTVFLLTGIWHGANFTFIAWGVFYAILLIAERLFLGKLLQKNPIKIINWVYTIFAVMIGWVYFRSDNILQANTFLMQLFSVGASKYSIFTYIDMKTILAVVVGVLFSGAVQRPLSGLFNKISKKPAVLIADYSLQFAIFILSALVLVSDTYNPFIYFQF